jgi:hypothetical protein
MVPAPLAIRTVVEGFLESVFSKAFPIFWIDRFHPNSVKHHTAFAAANRAGRCALRRGTEGGR